MDEMNVTERKIDTKGNGNIETIETELHDKQNEPKNVALQKQASMGLPAILGEVS